MNSNCKKELYEVPELTTDEVSAVTYNSADCKYSIIKDGGMAITSRGVCWSTQQSPTINDNKVADYSMSETSVINLSGLAYNTTYYIRAYATNNEGTGYGEQLTFTTINLGLATVTTNAITNITTTTAICGGNVSNSGGIGIDVTQRGLCWGTSPSPTIGNTYSINGSGIGSFSYMLTGLTFGMTYYIRAYAVNTIGIAYGNEVSFVAGQTATAPVVTTTAITNISQVYATGGGTVSSDGGANVTARGICWSTSNNPDLSNSFTTNGSGVGTFVSSLSGLNSGITYYVRAYATNIVGTSYGNEVSFITSVLSLPTVTTNSATGITTTSATSGGNVTNDGGVSVSAKGVCWSTAQNPTISDSHTNDGTGTGSFSSSITGLSFNTLYYVRAYATNSLGTAYGNQINFTSSSINVGDSYGGGVIGYILQPGDPGYIAGQTHGLIVAPHVFFTPVPWGCGGTLIGTSYAIGTGQANTTAIVSACSTSGIAARLCDDLVAGGYSDWYLPSLDEMTKLCQNQSIIGNFSSNFYWTSSELDMYNAKVVNFSGCGSSSGVSKGGNEFVRAVRSF